MKSTDQDAIVTRRMAWAMLTIGACVLVPFAAYKFARLGTAAISDARLIATPYAARRLAAYGVCDGLGVGYIERVLSVLPDRTLLPLLRYGAPQPAPASLLTGARRRADSRVLIGIDVALGDQAFAGELYGGPAPALPTGYTVVGSEGRCFVALRADFLAAIRAGRAGNDAQWLDALNQIHAGIR